ncbi:MAG: hypothetical protein ABSF77_20185 [Spirochaetia bacterium]
MPAALAKAGLKIGADGVQLDRGWKMDELMWDFLTGVAKRLGTGIKIHEDMKRLDTQCVYRWIRDAYLDSTIPTDGNYLCVPFWKRKAYKKKIFALAVKKAYSAYLESRTTAPTGRILSILSEVGMGDFVFSKESDEAGKQLDALMSKPDYDGRHREIVKLALKAGRPVPTNVVADYLDEPWAVGEMLRRTRNKAITFVARTAPTRSVFGALESFDCPAVENVLSLRRSQPLTVFAVFSEDALVTSITERPIFVFLAVFRTWVEAEKFIISRRQMNGDSTTLHLESFTILKKGGELSAVGSTQEFLGKNCKVLQGLETLLASN